MARKAASESESSRGFYDIIGVVLMCFAVLLLAALLSYHPRDVSANAVPPNSSIHNWIGPFGAWLAYGCFLAIGASAFALPVLLFFVGLGCFFNLFAYLRRRWACLMSIGSISSLSNATLARPPAALSAAT
jgi:S-DNA-T family DNA segregation ATPase FtsK/SpoIIIE